MTTTTPEQVPTRTAPLEPETREPLEPTTPIRPSEAIRLGCLTTAPHYGGALFGHGSACAIGAMMVGFGYGPEDEDDDYTIPKRLVNGLAEPCPDKGCKQAHFYEDGLLDNVIKLNDDHRWSRERIADWLEGLGL